MTVVATVTRAGLARARDTAPAADLELRDVLTLPVELLAGMPRPTTLELRLTWLATAPDAPGRHTRVVFTTSQRAHAEASEQGAAAWAPAEYSALALAVAVGRVRPPATSGPMHGVSPEFGAWCVAKRERGLVVTERVAMGGADGLVTHHEVYRDVRVRSARGSSWQPQLVGRARREAATDGTPLQRTAPLTLGELLERVGAELVRVHLHLRAPRPDEVSAQELAAM